MCDFGKKYAVGKELKEVLDFLQGYFPDACPFSEIVRGVKLDEQKVKRLVVYATDRSLVYVKDSSPEMDVTKEKFRLSGKGIDQLNEWG